MVGRPRLPGTTSQRAAARRQQVRENVRVFRQRNRDRLVSSGESSPEAARESSRRSSASVAETAIAEEDFDHSTDRIHQFQVSSVVVEGATEWSLGLPLEIDMGPDFANSFIKAFHQPSTSTAITQQEPMTIELTFPIYIDEAIDSGSQSYQFDTHHSPSLQLAIPLPKFVTVEVCFWGWTIATTIDITATSSLMIQEALLSSALGLLSFQDSNQTMVDQAMHIQTRAISTLRTELSTYSQNTYSQNENGNRAAIISATAMVLSMIELIVNKSWSGFSLHLQGIGALIGHAGPTSLQSPTNLQHFQQYRTFQLPFSVINRKSTFLAEPEWATFLPPSSASEQAFHALLAITFRLSSLLETYDYSTSNRTPSLLREMLYELNEITQRLDEWNSNFTNENPAPFTTRPATWTSLHPEAFIFTDETVAQCFTTHAATRIVLFGLVRTLASELITGDGDVGETDKLVFDNAVHEMEEWTKVVCQCVESFFVGEGETTGIGKLSALFALDCAWCAFLEMGETESGNRIMDIERGISGCRSIAEKIKKIGIPVLNMRST